MKAANSMKIRMESRHREIIEMQIKEINNDRLKKMLLLIFGVLFILIWFFYLPEIRIGKNVERNILYLKLNIIMLTVIAVETYVSKRFEKNQNSKIYDYLYSVGALIYLMEVSVYALLDSIYLGGISVYTAGLIGCAAITIIKTPINYFVFSGAQIFFIWLLYTFDYSNDFLVHNIINSSIFAITGMIMSKILYENQVNYLFKNLILEEVNQKMERLSNYDTLTELRNRRNFEEYVKKEFLYIDIVEEKGIVALMDIDYFKKVNDDYGHHAGDRVLKRVAQILSELVEEPSIVGRWGGEEFAIFFYNTSLDEIEMKLNRMREAIERSEIVDLDRKIKVTASFGFYSLIGTSDEELEIAFKKADKALYTAKNTGRNKVIRGE